MIRGWPAAGLALLAAAAGPAVAAPAAGLLTLRAAGVEVAVVPRLAGRVAVFRKAGGPNLLLWRPTTASLAEADIPRTATGYEFAAYHGHIVWIGPQEGWWADQDLDPARRASRPDWPPDPWGEVAPFEVVRRTRRAVTMRGPASPVTGLALTKEVAIEPDGRVRVRVEAENTRDRPVAWDLWSNTRVPGDARAYVAVGEGSRIRIEHHSWEPGKGAPLDYRVVGGWFTFVSEAPPPEGATHRVAKAFIAPRAGVVAAVRSGWVFVKRVAVVPPERTHPRQAFVEIYHHVARSPGDSMLELEMHGAYMTLAPGVSMSFEEVWEARPFTGEDSPAGHAAFLDRIAGTND